jgi:hypothetical protein
MEKSALCPDCGGVLAWETAIQGLCPQCLVGLALEESELEGQKTLDGASLSRVVADRSQMRELLRQEVRSAREVVPPNVCRIFDLVVEDDRELVSMEFIDGVTLGETLRDRGPFSELTPLGTLSPALVQPALTCGYRFEDEALVEESRGRALDGGRSGLLETAGRASTDLRHATSPWCRVYRDGTSFKMWLRRTGPFSSHRKRISSSPISERTDPTPRPRPSSRPAGG